MSPFRASHFITALAILVLSLSSLIVSANDSLTPHSGITPQQLTGEWYEIGLIPYFFEKNCASDPLVRYDLLDNESPEVFLDYFECRLANDDKQVNEGRLRVVDEERHTVLSATFFNFFGWRYWFGKNYWILDFNTEENYMVVGSPGRDNAWIMARSPELSNSALSNIKESLTNQGYNNACDLVLMPHQQSSINTKISLCDAIKDINTETTPTN